MLSRRISLWSSITHRFTSSPIFFHSEVEVRHFSWTIFSILLLCESLLAGCVNIHVCVLSPRLLPSLVAVVVVVRWRSRRRLGWVLSYLEESSLKWATVIHQLPSSPWRHRWFAHLLESQRTLLFFHICALFFFYLCTFLFLSLSVLCFYCGLSLPLLAMSPVSSSASVCGDDFFFCQILIQTSFLVSLLPQRLCIQSVSLSCIV